MNIVIIYGSVRSERKGIKAAEFVEKDLQQKGYKTELVDPKVYSLPLIDKMYKEFPDGDASETLQKLHNIIDSADGYIIVSGEYNHSLPPALTNLMDYFQKEYLYKPSAIISYSAGIFGGVRAAVHLRAFLAELGTVSIPSMLPVGKIGSAFDENLEPTDPKFHRRYDKFISEFIWYLKTFKHGRENFNQI